MVFHESIYQPVESSDPLSLSKEIFPMQEIRRYVFGEYGQLEGKSNHTDSERGPVKTVDKPSPQYKYTEKTPFRF